MSEETIYNLLFDRKSENSFSLEQELLVRSEVNQILILELGRESRKPDLKIRLANRSRLTLKNVSAIDVVVSVRKYLVVFDAGVTNLAFSVNKLPEGWNPFTERLLARGDSLEFIGEATLEWISFY